MPRAWSAALAPGSSRRAGENGDASNFVANGTFPYGPSHGSSDVESLDHRRIRVRDVLPIVFIHAICIGIFWTGWSWTAIGVAVALYWVRMFAITAFYHRYFSHRTFRTHRAVQFLFALLGTTAAQRGPLWWAAHHREHHRHSDHEPDPHSPGWRGVLWSHSAWFLTERGCAAPTGRQFRTGAGIPELVWLEKNHLVCPILLIAGLAAAGAVLAACWPSLGASAAQLVVWGFGVSTTALYHATFTINSVAHTIGSPYPRHRR